MESLASSRRDSILDDLVIGSSARILMEPAEDVEETSVLTQVIDQVLLDFQSPSPRMYDQLTKFG
ncbi:hypothetical protein POX_a00543 [Penicillium oxalicum]|uniref:hypothetical protein n=1 Tax=Penicillium oxalicum TaxID=69781 RepID=UPI0020B8302C|nr:hypothetical protein POX_a00543 [Penicillium oxalicum]KAI2793955.1 hypothetical protein POX_a00543 [Penicillium oxalicum]